MGEGNKLAKASGLGFGLGWAGIIVGAIACPPVAIVGAWVAIASMAGGALSLAHDKGKEAGKKEAEKKL